MNALTYGNSKTLSATFDTDYNPTNRTTSGGIANWTYTTDPNSNITQAGPTTYGYDAIDRVNGENGATTAYTYDATSNRLTKVQGTTTTTTVPATSNKISAVGASSYVYDAAGNITSDGINAYGWNSAGNLATVNTTGGVYTYNAYNQRTKKVAASVTTQYVYGTNGLLEGEYSSTGVMQREYIYLNDTLLAQVTAGSPETVAYLHTDHLGTPRFATNRAGASVWSWTNDAFGVSTASGSVTVSLRMPGQYFDAESGLFYNWNRYYNPAIGRYIPPDPIGLAGGINNFSYVFQNPVNMIDPGGLNAALPLPGLPFDGNPLLEPPANDGNVTKQSYTKIPIPGSPSGLSSNNICTADGDQNSSEQPPLLQNVGRKSRSQCVDECLHHLSRPLSEDERFWNFQICMNNCMGVNQLPY